MAMSPLLELPAELRLRIYNFVVSTIPLSAPPAQYAGLLYSCKFIRQELEPEILKRMTVFLFDVQDRCRHVHPEDMVDDRLQDLEFNVPQDLPSLYNLRVQRPSYHKLFTRDDPFMALMYIYFNTLSIISVHQPDQTPHRRDIEEKRTQRNMGSIARWIGSRDPGAAEPAARNIAYDWSGDRQLGYPKILRDTKDWLWNRDSWALVYRRHWDDYKIEGVEFMRAGTALGSDIEGNPAVVDRGGWCTMKDGVLQSFLPFTS
jgi:hypothetical protein